ncbi:hypothetical protein PMI13_04184 [Chryseobacterium populi]|uniref:Uncharacterized protein n=1 Tax=Chryseobacterium populi TaxID=1144316 RepID=J2JHY3_9FLAO|nr:hypothetical protein PMI13_04184 [Chryseobacterium populi]
MNRIFIDPVPFELTNILFISSFTLSGIKKINFWG